MANWDTNITSLLGLWGIGDICFEYNVPVSGICPSNTPSLTVRFFNDATLMATESISPIGNDGANWIFNINAKSAVECFYDNKQTLCDPGETMGIGQQSILLNVEVDIYEATPDDCCLELTGTDTSPFPFQIGNFLIKPGVNYENFDNRLGTFGVKRFMTTRPRPLSTVCLDQSLCFYYFQGISDSIRITTFDSSGNQIANNIIPGPAGAFATIPVGPANHPGIIDENVAYYEVAMTILGGVLDASNVWTFKVDCNCCSDCKIHWLSCFGGFESHHAQTFNQKGLATTSESFQNNLPKNPALRDSGITTLQTFSREKKVVTLTSHSEAEMEWLAEIGKSPCIFLEENGQLVSYNRDDFDIIYWDKNECRGEFVLTLTRSYQEASHRN